MAKTPNLLSLRYPMFETTEVEKQILRACDMDYVVHPYETTYLCHRIGMIANRTWTGRDCGRLRDKIMEALSQRNYGNVLASLYPRQLGPRPSYKTKIMLRRIWIQKLLAYNP